MHTSPISELESCLKELKKNWPGQFNKEVRLLFEKIQTSLENLKNGSEEPSSFFSLMGALQEVIKANDFLFLSRKLTYHIATVADLPNAFGLKKEAHVVLTTLFNAASKFAVFGSQIEIHLSKIQLRDGAAIQLKMVCTGKILQDEERQKILEQFYGAQTSPSTMTDGVAFARNLLKKLGGQLWFEFPQETQVAFVLNWPTFLTTQKMEGVGTYKYDITIVDYSKIRQRFGIDRSAKLVDQVSTFIKALVRFPLDIVVGFPDQGLVSVIYEFQEGSLPQAISTRLSSRLKNESFKVGRKSVIPRFRYQLSCLT